MERPFPGTTGLPVHLVLAAQNFIKFCESRPKAIFRGCASPGCCPKEVETFPSVPPFPLGAPEGPQSWVPEPLESVLRQFSPQELHGFQDWTAASQPCCSGVHSALCQQPRSRASGCIWVSVPGLHVVCSGSLQKVGEAGSVALRELHFHC